MPVRARKSVCCDFMIKVPRAMRGTGVGRGHGLRTGGAAFSKMQAHVRQAHPDQPRHELTPGRPAP